MPVLLRSEGHEAVLRLEPSTGELRIVGSWSLPNAGLLPQLRPLITCDVLLRTLRTHGLAARYVWEVPAAGAEPSTAEGIASGSAAPLPSVPSGLALIAPDECVWAGTPSPTCARLERPGSGVSPWPIAIGPMNADRIEPTSTAAFEAEPEVLRHAALSAHYRAALLLEASALEEAERRVEYLYRTRDRLRAIPSARTVESSDVPEEVAGFEASLDAALADDLNTPLALELCEAALKPINDLAERAKSKKGKVGRDAIQAAEQALELIERRLGLGGGDGSAMLTRFRARRAALCGIDAAEVERRIHARTDARTRRDYAQADALRDEITALGIELIDGPEATQWRIP